MAHTTFAKVENGIVTQVIVADQDVIDSLVDANKWIQTTTDTRGGIHYGPSSNVPPYSSNPDGGIALRKNYAGIGYTYDVNKDAFIPPKPYDSWLLDDSTCLWESSIPYPNDGKVYDWNEDNIEWVEWVPEEDDG
tara:strand:+ start:603 stop:1007 length:405 start_codon:yes stop_codon:yes gene_type:complete